MQRQPKGLGMTEYLWSVTSAALYLGFGCGYFRRLQFKATLNASRLRSLMSRVFWRDGKIHRLLRSAPRVCVQGKCTGNTPPQLLHHSYVSVSSYYARNFRWTERLRTIYL